VKRLILIYSAATLRWLGNRVIAVLRIALWPRRRPTRAARICVYRIGAIGDLVCATPALFAIRRAYPDAHLTLLTTAGKYGHSLHATDLLDGVGWIDEIIVYDLDEIGSIAGRLELGARLRANHFDLWFDLTLERARFSRILRDMLFARLLGVRWAFGWRLDHFDFAARAEAEVKEFPDEVERLAATLHSCGIGDATIFPPIPGDAAPDLPQRLLGDFGTDCRPLIAIAPGARRPCNLWPTQRFVAVARSLRARGVAVALLGGADDRPMCEEIASGCGSDVINLAGNLSIGQSRAMLHRCDLLICVDSGPQHLAASVGTPCVALFSQRNPRRRWYPHGSRHRVLEGAVECHTCLLDVCPRDNLCMKQITVDEVLAATEDIVQTTRTGRADQRTFETASMPVQS
jgi:ADP-heptose:LPS heptosyltransferase